MDDDLLGDIYLFPYSFIPMGYALCDGSTMNIMQNQALFSLLGDLYGSDLQTYFKLPNLLGTEPVPGLCYCICTSGIYPPRQ